MIRRKAGEGLHVLLRAMLPGADIPVPREFLRRPDVVTAFHAMRREKVAKGVEHGA